MNIFIERDRENPLDSVQHESICRWIKEISPASKVYLLPSAPKPWHEIFNLELHRIASGIMLKKTCTDKG